MSNIFAFIVIDEQLFEIGHGFFRNDDKAASLRDEIMVGEYDRGSLIAVEKDLRFHAI